MDTKVLLERVGDQAVAELLREVLARLERVEQMLAAQKPAPEGEQPNVAKVQRPGRTKVVEE